MVPGPASGIVPVVGDDAAGWRAAAIAVGWVLVGLCLFAAGTVRAQGGPVPALPQAAPPLLTDAGTAPPLPPGSQADPAPGPPAATAVQAPGTRRWTVTSAISGYRPLFALDLDTLVGAGPDPAGVPVLYGPSWDGFLWLSGRWGLPGADAGGEQLLGAEGTGGPAGATLSYAIESSRLGLVMSMRMEFTPDPATGAYTVRLHQGLCASRDTVCDGTPDFLRVRAAPAGARDWGDGTPDYAWYRWPGDECPDAPPGGHTGVIRAAGSALRVAAMAGTGSPGTTEAASRPAGAGVPLTPGITIGGYFSKAGVGSCGWVFHRYRASAPQGPRPFLRRGRSGAETRFSLWPATESGRFALQAGDRIDVQISLTMLPSEVCREDIEDLNEADLHLFGADPEQAAGIAGWVGTRNAVGLLHGDGSMILLGLGREPGEVPVPAATVAKATNAYRLFDLVRPTYDYLDLKGNRVEVRPGWITVIDCGAALWEPSPTPDSMFFAVASGVAALALEGDGGEKPAPWPQPPTGGPFQGMLMRK